MIVNNFSCNGLPRLFEIERTFPIKLSTKTIRYGQTDGLTLNEDNLFITDVGLKQIVVDIYQLTNYIEKFAMIFTFAKKKSFVAVF